jgi:predicted ABC-type exoprotein transport system permease subunit
MKKIFDPKLADLIILVLILIVIIYEGLINKFKSNSMGPIIAILLVISTIIKIIYVGKEK